MSLVLTLLCKFSYLIVGFPGGAVVKNLPVMQEMLVTFLGWEDTLKKEWEPTPVFLPGKSHGQRSLVSYSP